MPSSDLVEPWLRGVAANLAAPSEVLLRLLTTRARAVWTILCEERDLPADVVEAVIAHPERAVRRGFARNGHAAVEQRGRLVCDPDARCAPALPPVLARAWAGSGRCRTMSWKPF